MNANCLPRLFLIPALLAAACSSPDQQSVGESTPQSSPAPEAVSTSQRIEGWWNLGDSFGPFTAYYEGNDLLRIEESLDQGEYGSSRAEYHYENGKLVRHTQESLWRLMDPEDPHRLVPVAFEMEFDGAGSLVSGHKTVDRMAADLDPLDEDRVRGHARTLEELARAFADAYSRGKAPVRFICGEDESFKVVSYPGGILLDLGPFEGRFLLEQVPSGSGSKYSDGTLTFWSKGNEAFVEQGSGRIFSDCLGES